MDDNIIIIDDHYDNRELAMAHQDLNDTIMKCAIEGCDQRFDITGLNELPTGWRLLPPIKGEFGEEPGGAICLKHGQEADQKAIVDPVETRGL